MESPGWGFLTGKYKRDVQPENARLSAARSGTWENVWDKRATERNWAILDCVSEIAQQHSVTQAQVAVAWIHQKPGITSPIIGARNLEQLEDNLAGAQLTLSAEEMTMLDEVSKLEDVYPYRFLRNAELNRDRSQFGIKVDNSGVRK